MPVRDKDSLIEHHVKYIETHGVDETIFVTLSEHAKIDHRKLFPMVSQKELAIISSKAHRRTKKYKELQIERSKDYHEFISQRYKFISQEEMERLAREQPII